MISYSHKNGYGNINLEEVEEVIRSLPGETTGRYLLLNLMYDYECILRVIEGHGFVFSHEDGSETRRIKLWS